MQEFIGSMVRLSTALTIYGIQQVRHGVSELAATPINLERVREVMDTATNSLRSKIDESQKPTFNSMTTFGEDILAKTCDTVKNSVPDASELLRNTSDMLRRRAASVMNSSAAATPEASEAAEPQSASAFEETADNPETRRGTRRKGKASGSGEPQPAADVL